MYKVTVFISLRQEILNPEAVAVQEALHRLGFEEVKSLRMSKTIELILDKNENMDLRIKEMCEKLLVNTIIEDYFYEIKEVNE